MMIDFPTTEERRIEAQRLLEGLNGQWVAERMGVSKATVPDLEDLLRLPDATQRPLKHRPTLSDIRWVELGKRRGGLTLIRGGIVLLGMKKEPRQ